jgi:hypothetical protein
MHHAEAGRKAVPTIDCHHRNDGEIDEFRLGELPGYAALPYWQTDCLLVGVGHSKAHRSAIGHTKPSDECPIF